MSIQMKLFRKLAMVSLMTIFSGCAGANSSLKSDRQLGQAQGSVLREVSVVGEGAATQVVIAANKPLVYTFYKTAAPPTAVVDLAQVDVGSVVSPQEINQGIVKRIVTTHYGEGATAMTRVEVYLSRDAEVTAAADPQDKGLLRLSIVPPDSPAAEAPAAASTSAGSESPAAKAGAADKQPQPATAVPTPVNNAETKPATAVAPTVAAVKAEPEAKGPVVVSSIVAAANSIDIITSGPVADFKSFGLTKPDRFVIDLFGVKSGFESRVVPVNSLNVGTARIGAYPDKVRIVLDAAEGNLPPLAIDRFASGLKVVPAGAAGGAGTPSEVSAAAAAPAVSAAKPAPTKETLPVRAEKKLHPVVVPAVESIDFKELPGASRVIVTVTDGCELDRAAKTADGLTFTIKNCLLPRKWQRYLDTSAFAGAVERVTPYQVKVQGRHDVKVQVKLRSDVPFDLKQDGTMVYLDVKNPQSAREVATPVSPSVATATKKSQPAVAREMSPDAALMAIATPAGEGGKVYTGRRVTLEFSDADIRKIFQLIAEVSNLNFIVGDDVTGTISLKLVNVPWDQALDVILENKGLGMQREGNIVQIRPKAKIQTLADEQQALHKAEEKAMPLKTEVFDINFASVSDVASQFNALKSERGTITQDARTNRVIVKDIEPALKEMRALLKNLDIPERQVLIEARIVEATSTFTRDLGVQWGIHYKDGSASFANINGLDAGFGGVVTAPPSTGFQTSDSSGGAVGISFGTLTSNINVDMRLSAAAVAGLVKIISTPKVVTLNNKSAKISQGQSIPYQTTSAEGTKTEFVEAALTLEVTPHITSDGSISMKIKASNNSAGTGSPPPINKKEATTELLVKNSETTVIGGIYVDSDSDQDQGVPFLMDIPLLGWLFKSNTKTKTKTELLIFITPKIVS